MHHVSLLSCEAASFEVQRRTVAAVQTAAAYLSVIFCRSAKDFCVTLTLVFVRKHL